MTQKGPVQGPPCSSSQIFLCSSPNPAVDGTSRMGKRALNSKSPKRFTRHGELSKNPGTGSWWIRVSFPGLGTRSGKSTGIKRTQFQWPCTLEQFLRQKLGISYKLGIAGFSDAVLGGFLWLDNACRLNFCLKCWPGLIFPISQLWPWGIFTGRAHKILVLQFFVLQNYGFRFFSRICYRMDK